LQAVRVVLLSQEYENLTFINTQKGRSSLNYVMEFKYDPGMEPYPVPGAPNAKGITTTIPKLPAGKIEDTFVLLKKTHFNDEGTLTNYEIYFPPHELYPNIENLLNNTEFNPVDGPQDIIPSFTNNTQIFCDCGESIKFVEMKYCISKDPKFPGFEFYLAIGQKCGCGKTPYVLFPSPGNKDIPADLKDLF
jgi:hypothetical protein